jgi:3-isopropylmalate/(R)-2-methylmalate dehydratase small subunit
MKKLKKITSACVPIPEENVDTDQIMPARFLVSVTKTGYGEKCFYDWRYNEDHTLDEDCILNDEKYQKRDILVAGHNFGCGSSREHAVWGLVQYGFRVVISSKFADIFRNNSLKNGLLLITISPDDLQNIFERIEEDDDFELTVDLESQVVKYAQSSLENDGKKIEFDIEPFWKECIMQGMDDTAYILSHKEEIEKYEKQHEK